MGSETVKVKIGPDGELIPLAADSFEENLGIVGDSEDPELQAQYDQLVELSTQWQTLYGDIESKKARRLLETKLAMAGALTLMAASLAYIIVEYVIPQLSRINSSILTYTHQFNFPQPLFPHPLNDESFAVLYVTVVALATALAFVAVFTSAEREGLAKRQELVAGEHNRELLEAKLKILVTEKLALVRYCRPIDCPWITASVVKFAAFKQVQDAFWDELMKEDEKNSQAHRELFEDFHQKLGS